MKEMKSLGKFSDLRGTLLGLDWEVMEGFWNSMREILGQIEYRPKETLESLKNFIHALEADLVEGGRCPSCAGKLKKRESDDEIYKQCEVCYDTFDWERIRADDTGEVAWRSAKGC